MAQLCDFFITPNDVVLYKYFFYSQKKEIIGSLEGDNVPIPVYSPIFFTN